MHLEVTSTPIDSNSAFDSNSTKTILTALQWSLLLTGILSLLRLSLTYAQLGGDLSQDYWALYSWNQGGSIYLYQLPEETITSHFPTNFHPPTLLLLLTPFVTLSYKAFFHIFNLLSIFVYCLLVRDVCRTYLPTLSAGLVLGMSLWFYPLIFTIGTGNVSVFVAAFVHYGLKYHKKNQVYKGGWLWALAASMKLFPILLCIPLLLCRKVHAALTTAALFACLCLSSHLVFGEAAWPEYLFVMIPDQMRMFIAELHNQSPHSLTINLVTSPPYSSFTVSLLRNLITTFFLIVTTYVTAKRNRSRGLDEVFFLWYVALLLATPILWSHYLILLIPPLAFIFKTQPRFFWLVLVFSSIPTIDIARWIVQSYGAEPSVGLKLLARIQLAGLFALWLFFIREVSRPTGASLGRRFDSDDQSCLTTEV